jgi:hypothetical protein
LNPGHLSTSGSNCVEFYTTLSRSPGCPCDRGGASCKSWATPRYRSVVWIDGCTREIWICSRGSPEGQLGEGTAHVVGPRALYPALCRSGRRPRSSTGQRPGRLCGRRDTLKALDQLPEACARFRTHLPRRAHPILTQLEITVRGGLDPAEAHSVVPGRSSQNG